MIFVKKDKETQIRIDKMLTKSLKSLKITPRESYNEIIKRLLKYHYKNKKGVKI